MKNLEGQRFGRLVVLRKDTSRKGNYWVCQCDCGVVKSIRGKNLLSGDTQSCGCLQQERRKLPKNHCCGKAKGKIF